MRAKTKWLLLMGLATTSVALSHCVGDEPATNPGGSDEAGTDSGVLPDNFVPSDGGSIDAGADAATVCANEAAANGVTCGAGVNPCIVQIEGGGRTFCARDTSCKLYCWGDNTDGQLGLDPATTPFSQTPVAINFGAELVGGFDVGGTFDILPGQSVVCARVAILGGNPTVACWGANEFGQLGVPDAGPQQDSAGHPISTTPVAVPTINTVGTIGVGALHVCAITLGKTGSPAGLYCWGDNANGELGRVTTGTMDPNPGIVTGVIPDNLGVGYRHTCVTLANGHVLCAGDDNTDQLGFDGGGVSAVNSTFTTVTGINTLGATAGGQANCAIGSVDSLLRCWGDNTQGQLGNGGFVTPNPTPTPVAVLTTVSGGVLAGARNMCANLGTTNLSDGGLAPLIYCWGANDVGESALPTDGGNLPLPTPVQGLPNLRMVKLGVGAQASCAVASDGTVWCWGQSIDGELGTRTDDTDGGNGLSVKPPGRVMF